MRSRLLRQRNSRWASARAGSANRLELCRADDAADAVAELEEDGDTVGAGGLVGVDRDIHRLAAPDADRFAIAHHLVVAEGLPAILAAQHLRRVLPVVA